MGLFSKLFGDRNFNAALNIMMAEYTYCQMSQKEQKRVDEATTSVLEVLGRRGSASHVQFLPVHQRYCIYTIAMIKLGIKPAIKGENWRFNGNPVQLLNEIPDDAVLERAYFYLEEKHGISLKGGIW